MSAARARKILLAAFAVSVLLHLLLAGYIRWPALLRPREEAQIAKVRVITIARVTPRPPPPAPPPTPRATPAARASIAPPPVTARSSKTVPAVPKAAPPAVIRTAPPPAATPAPTRAATPSSSACVHSSTGPAVTATPDAAEIPPEVRAAKVSGTAAIAVSLDPQGRVTGTTVSQSTGNSGLDAVAAQMARGATYTPKYAGCKAVAGTYTFTVKFVAW